MEIILLEKIAQLGDPGDLVNVKAGYGRNFLIPNGKAVRADEENKAEYEKKLLAYDLDIYTNFYGPFFCFLKKNRNESKRSNHICSVFI